MAPKVQVRGVTRVGEVVLVPTLVKDQPGRSCPRSQGDGDEGRWGAGQLGWLWSGGRDIEQVLRWCHPWYPRDMERVLRWHHPGMVGTSRGSRGGATHGWWEH